MTVSRKLLIFGGLALAAWGMCYGLVYAVFIEHQALDGIGSSLAVGFMQAAQRHRAESQASLADAASRSYVYVRQVDAHGHWIGLALLLLILGIAFDHVAFSEGRRNLLAAALFLGSVLFPLGVLLETWNRGIIPQAIAVVGSAFVILGLCGAAWGFARSGEP
jgi:hypothetical protein